MSYMNYDNVKAGVALSKGDVVCNLTQGANLTLVTARTVHPAGVVAEGCAAGAPAHVIFAGIALVTAGPNGLAKGEVVVGTSGVGYGVTSEGIVLASGDYVLGLCATSASAGNLAQVLVAPRRV